MLDPASPIARNANPAPRTANAMPRAVRAEDETCAATAATAVNTRPEPISARPNASDPGRGTPVAARLMVPSTPTATAPPPPSSNAAVRFANRPTAVAEISSARPVSSSARVCRITVSITAIPISV